MYYTIYKITNKINNKIYIGQHKTDNLDDGYMGSGVLIKRAIIKYGIEQFEKEILYVFEDADTMCLMESEIVDEEFVKRDDTYNLSTGGRGSWYGCYSQGLNNKVGQCYILRDRIKESDEYAEWFSRKVTNSLLKYYETNPHPWEGRKHNDESKRKIGEANSKHQKGEGNSQYGTCWIHNLEEKISKKIPKDELEDWLELGWIKGRKMKF
jgi:hypothetical protein